MSKLSERRREIRAMDLTTAQHELADLRRQLFSLRLQLERGEVKNNRQFPQTKADIARLMYHIGELQHEAAMAAEGALIEVEPEETELALTASDDTAEADEASEADETEDEDEDEDEDDEDDDDDEADEDETDEESDEDKV